MKTTLHIPDDLLDRLKLAALKEKTSMAKIIRRLALAAYPAPKKGAKA